MERTLLPHLVQWLSDTDRRPLVLRGARQVGKTWLVRHLAKITGRTLIELNFEKNASWIDLFSSNEPQEILLNLSAATKQTIHPEGALLFLDEIQSAPQLLSKLRWFAEDLPTLPVIAAGSLLEFALADHTFSMPVGRINYLYLEPLSFEEFLIASGQSTLMHYLQNYKLTQTIPESIHQECLSLFKEYIFVGGLPAAVSSWCNTRSLVKLGQIQHDLLTTYREDFAKYRGRIAAERLDEMSMAIPRMLGQKFIYSNVNDQIQTSSMKHVFHLLEQARLCHRISATAGNGLPMAAEVKPKHFKAIFLDIGLCNAILGVPLNQLTGTNDINVINQGQLSEQVVGQALRTLEPPYVSPSLYYWQREASGSNAEIDYLIQHHNQIIPIEVKSGSTGSLKSLHAYMGLKQGKLAVRINSDYPSKTIVDLKNSFSMRVNYQLLSIPFYLIGQLHRLLNDETPLTNPQDS